MDVSKVVFPIVTGALAVVTVVAGYQTVWIPNQNDKVIQKQYEEISSLQQQIDDIDLQIKERAKQEAAQTEEPEIPLWEEQVFSGLDHTAYFPGSYNRYLKDRGVIEHFLKNIRNARGEGEDMSRYNAVVNDLMSEYSLTTESNFYNVFLNTVDGDYLHYTFCSLGVTRNSVSEVEPYLMNVDGDTYTYASKIKINNAEGTDAFDNYHYYYGLFICSIDETGRLSNLDASFLFN